MRPAHSSLFLLTGTLLVAPLLTGCGGARVQGFEDTNRVLTQRNVELEQEIGQKEQTIAMLRDSVRNAEDRAAREALARSHATAELRAVGDDYTDLVDRMDELNIDILPADLKRALEMLAMQNSDLMTYDAKSRMIRLSSDLTFDLGSDQLKSEAEAGLADLAGVLSNVLGAEYGVEVVGHTDNVPIKNIGTRQKHPTNLHLSVHRAISVREAMVAAGISPGRVSIMGWGAMHPIVPNPARGGARENRRVEIFIVAATDTTTDMTWDAAPTNNRLPDEGDAAPPRREEPMK